MAKRRSDAAETVEKKENPRKPKQEIQQGYLPDGEGGDMKPKRIKPVDLAIARYCESRDQVAEWKRDQDEAREAIQEMLREHGVDGPYFADHRARKYAFELCAESRLSVTAVKEDV